MIMGCLLMLLHLRLLVISIALRLLIEEMLMSDEALKMTSLIHVVRDNVSTGLLRIKQEIQGMQFFVHILYKTNVRVCALLNTPCAQTNTFKQRPTDVKSTLQQTNTCFLCGDKHDSYILF